MLFISLCSVYARKWVWTSGLRNEPTVSSSCSVPYIVYMYRCSILNQSFSVTHIQSQWASLKCWDFCGNIYNCKYQICFLWMCSSIYLKLAFLAKAFASKHLCCDILGTWTWTGTLTQPNSLKAKMSINRSTSKSAIILLLLCNEE